MSKKIRLAMTRDLGTLFGDTFTYLRTNFKSFFGAILVFAGPFFLLNSLAGSIIFKASFSNALGKSDLSTMLSEMALPFLLIFLFSILGSAVFNTIVNAHMLKYEELEEDKKPAISDVRPGFFPAFWRNLGTMFLTMILTIVIYILLAMVLGVFIVMLKAMGVIGILLMVLFFMFLFIVIVPVFVYIVVAIVFNGQRHKVGFFTSLGMVMGFLKGNFWTTWVMSFLGGLTTYVLIFIAYLPVYILMIMSLVTRVKMNDINSVNDIQNEIPIYVTVLTSLVSILIICISSIYIVMMNLHSAGLEEKATGKSILDRIDNI